MLSLVFSFYYDTVKKQGVFYIQKQLVRIGSKTRKVTYVKTKYK